MANWTGLAGAAGLAAALEEIQGRRVREGELQRKLTEGQGEWTPATGGMGGPLGFFDALFGYNKPGQIGFGGQRYQFQPYPTMTEQDAQRLQLTTPETTTTLAYEKPLPPNVQGPLELVPEQQTTREVPLPGFVGQQKMTPEFLKTITLEQLRERRELAKQAREQAFWKQLQPGGGGAGTGTGDILEGTFDLGGGGATGTTGTTGTGTTETPAKAPLATASTQGSAPAKGDAWVLSPVHRLIVDEANRQGVDPQVALAVAMQESYFSPDAVGKGGEVGLFQFTKGAATDMQTTKEALRGNTPLQIKTGIGFLKKKLEESKGVLTTALQRYNGGGDPNYVANVQRWLPPSRQLVSQLGTQTPAPPTAQTVVGAQGQPADTSMLVAGDAAPAPKTTTAQTTGAAVPSTTTATQPTTTQTTTTTQPTTTAQVSPTATEAFQLTPQARSTIESNNRKTIGINAQLRELRTRKEQLLSSPVAGTPRGTAYIQDFTTKINELEKDKNTLREDSQKLYEKELGEHRQKGTKVGEETRGEEKDIRKEQRKPDVEGNVKAAEMNVTTDPELRNLTRDLADKGIVGNADYNKNSEPDKAIVIRTAKKYADNKALVENLDGPSKSALSQILKEDNTPMGEVTKEQLQRAREKGIEFVKQHEYDKVEAQRLAKLNAPMEAFALKYFHPKLLRVADGTMTAPQAEKLGYRLMPVENQKTMMAADNSISSINRVYTLLFGGDDPDGSITGTVGQPFDGIYPTLEKGRTDTQSAIARTKMNWQLKKGIFQGTDIGQSASALQKYIQGTLGALSRDLGGERGHFTDFDARRIQGLFQDLQTGMFAVGPMTSSGEAKKLMRSIVATISDRVRTSGSLRRDDPLPWNVSGERRKEPQAGGTATGGTSAPPAGEARTPAYTPPATTQETVPASGTAQEPVPTPPVAQETAPAPVAPTSQRPNAPAAAQPEQRLQQLTTQYPPAQHGGKKITDPVTGIRYRSDGTAWREIQ